MFSFIVVMPTAHRIACLRDDVVFFIYLYQRYLYPVDMARPNEYGIAYAETPSPVDCAESKPATEVKGHEKKLAAAAKLNRQKLGADQAKKVA